MDNTSGSWSDADCPQTAGDFALAGGAVGGLFGLMFGPIGTLACVVVGAAIGYVQSCRVLRGAASRAPAGSPLPARSFSWPTRRSVKSKRPL